MSATTLFEWVEQGLAAAHPDKPAIRSERGALAWGELLAGARAVAAFLRDAGVGRGHRVGLWMDKTPRCVEALLGVLGAGAAYVPLDPRAPVARAAGIARDCGLSALFTDAPRRAALGPLLAGTDAPLLVLDDPALDRRAAAALAPGRRVVPLDEALAFPPSEPARPHPGDLAYVLYTSGSTGRPKGVAHTHASGLSFARWMRDRFQLRSDDVFSAHAPLHFDLSVSDLFASLGAGASVRLLSPTEGMLAPYLVRMLDAWGITVWYSVPSALVAMLEQGGLEARPPERLRVVFFAGEVFPMAQLRRLRRALPRATLVNLFGPTETNVCTYQVVPERLPEPGAGAASGAGVGATSGAGAFTGFLPIGHACEDLETFVVDDEGGETDLPGAEGTLWARGPHVMQGYLGEPERTAAVLKPDPRGRPGLACCTGDRVRILPDGGYEFRGRRDHLVKVKGHRVELGEIEAVLAEHPGVREAVAVALPDPAAGCRIVAAAVPRAGASPSVAELRAHLAARLPRYMLPAGLEVLAELPRTSTGKADRGRLAERWEGGGAHGDDRRAEPG